MASSKNILLISSWYPSAEHPTLGNFVERHCKSIALYQNACIIYATVSNQDKIEVEQKGQLTEVIVYYQKKLPLTSYLKAMKKAYKKALELYGEFDLAHVHVAYPAGLFALSLKLPLVITEHFTGYLPYSKFKWGIWKKNVTKRILKKAKILLPVSENLGKALLQFSPQSNYQKVSNVVDTSIFYPADSKPEVFTFLHVSTLNESTKNISGLLDAFALLQKSGQEFKLLIGGDGDTEELRKKIADRKLSNVEVFGEKSSDEIADLMRKSNCFVLASHVENQPCVILEALCCGLTVISTDVGGIREEIDRDNGLLTEPGNTKAFYTAMQQMIENYSNYNSTEIASKAQNNYSNEAIGKQLNDIYLNVLNKDS